MVVGLLAGLFTTACWVPQLARSLRTRKVDSFSWAYLAAMETGIALWLAYGFIRSDLDIELPNALSLVAISMLFAWKIHLTWRARQPALPRMSVDIGAVVPAEIAEAPVA